MATRTENIKLIKPDLDDDADIRVINGNMDIIDGLFPENNPVVYEQDLQTHNTSDGAHADIRNKIDTDITAHNTNDKAHKDVFAKYLPLTGGTLSGDLTLAKNGDSTHFGRICGGKFNDYGFANMIARYGNEQVGLQIETANGSNGVPFIEHSSDGGATNDKVVYIPLSVNGIGADSNGNIKMSLGTSYVVESVVNDDGSWYRKYSDGWLEQGWTTNGKELTIGNGYIITLLKPYATTNYHFQANTCHVLNSGGANCITKSTTKVTFKATTTSSTATSWFACGMGVE